MKNEILDFFSGIHQCLNTDNGIMEGEVFNLLNDFKYVLQSIATSLQEIGVDEEGNQTDDILVESFVQ